MKRAHVSLTTATTTYYQYALFDIDFLKWKSCIVILFAFFKKKHLVPILFHIKFLV